jgi:RNA polymerase sigma factor (sigma-70 family)
MMGDDMSLVREFAASRSEPAFTALVKRHIGLVHSAAMRQVGDAHLAEEIAQAVFILLARKAPSLGSKTVLSAWLYRTARYAAANASRARSRRQHREQEAYMQSTSNESEADKWAQVAPLLDDAMAELGETDHAALVLRFFENKTLGEVAGALHVNEGAAQRRVLRAVEKLRGWFTRRGVVLPAAVLTAAISANSVQAAPVGLAVTISATTLKGTAVAASVTALVNGTIKTIFMTTLQKTLIAAIIIAALATPLVLKNREVARLRKEVVALQWEKNSLLSRIKSEGAATPQVADDAAVPKVQVSERANPLPAEVVAKIAALLSDRKPMDKARTEAWARLMAQIPPDQLGQALQAALQLTDHEIRTAISQTLFRTWIETNPRAALAFATANFQGREKSDAIRDALQHWAAQDPDGAFAAWREQAADATKRLSWGGGQQETVKALFEGMAQQDFQKAAENLKGLDGDLFSSALKGLGATAGKTEQGREFFLNQLKQVSDQPVSYEAMSSFMHSWAQNDLPSAKTWVENQPAGNQRDYALRQVGLNYVRRDPKTGAEWWLAQATPAERSRAYFDIGQEWASSDIKAAADWLNQQAPGNALDSGLSGFADVAVEHDPTTALKWAESISQLAHRNAVLVGTWQKWRRLDSAAAEQFLTQCGWPADLVAQARGKAANK